MRNIKIKYEYDGTDFFGMQKQEKARTVAGEIEKILNVILKEKINLSWQIIAGWKELLE